MPNKKSAWKRMEISQKQRQKNRQVKSTIKRNVKEFRRLIIAGETEKAEQKLKDACQLLDRAASKGVLHKNTVARKKSRLMRQQNKALQSKSTEEAISEA